MNRHKTAIIEPGAKIGEGTEIGPYTYIRSNVVIGENNYIGPFVSIGEPGEHSSHPNTPKGKIVIGNNNRISDHVSIHSPIHGKTTQIGNDCYIMSGVYIAHDCIIMDRVSLSAKCKISGSVIINPYCNLGVGVAVHQGIEIAEGAMIGMNACVIRNILEPWFVWVGVPAIKKKFNTIGFNRYAK